MTGPNPAADLTQARLAIRSGAVLIAVPSAIVLVTQLAGGIPVLDVRVGFNVLSIVVAAALWWGFDALWRRLGIGRWPRWVWVACTLLIPAFYLAVLPASARVAPDNGPGAPYGYVGTVFLAFAWIGASQPRGAAIAMAPFAALCLYDTLDHVPGTVDQGWMVLVLVPFAVTIGEVMAWTAESFRRAQQLERRRARDLERLADSVARIRGQESLEQAATVLAEVALGSFHGDHASVLVDPDGRDPVVVQVGRPECAPSLDMPALLRSFVTSREVVLRPGDPTTKRPTLLTLPLIGRSGPIGALCVTQSGPTDRFSRFSAQLFAAQAGAALEQRQTMDSLVADAEMDPLTGVGNRRRAARLLASLDDGDALALVDLDDFKTINDREGHVAGDRFLVQVAAHLAVMLRTSDEVARFGGDEFLVVMRGVGPEAISIAERIVEGWRGEAEGLTVSVGVAVHTTARTPDETLELADGALYAAKAAGRDQALLSSS